jgi:putative transposase
LVRRHDRGDFHFITFSCDQRRPYLNTPAARELVEDALETARIRYEFVIAGYVVMPEHVHLLLSEPYARPLASMIQAIKVAVSKRSSERPFWLSRYYDFNIFTPEKYREKLRYIHRNPVTRGLVPEPEDWLWSSFRHCAFGDDRGVEIESDRTAARRERAGTHP